jgi:hypothetical protein
MTRLDLSAALCVAVCMAGSAGAAAPRPVSELPGCRVDGATGLPMPQGAKGACASGGANESLLVQRSDEGLLIVRSPKTPTYDGAETDGARNLTLRDATARVIFCPSSLLDFATGAPGPGCLKAADPREPGPGAFVGTGAVRAGLSIDAGGRTGCPSAARVTASVASPDGVRLALTGSIVALQAPGRPDTCASAYDRIELSYGGDAPAAPPSVAAPADRTSRLMQLDDEQWQVVDLLLALTPQDWAALEAALSAPRSAAPGAAPPGGTASAGTASTGGGIAPLGFLDVINAILDRVNAVRSDLSSVASRIPDRADVRALVGQIDLSGLSAMLTNIGDTLQGLLDIAAELRNGFESFDAVAFRGRLDTVLGDLESVSGLSQQLLCVYDPNVTVREISLDPVRRLLDHTPAVILYGLSRILDAADPQWDQRLGSMIDAVPPSVTALCNSGAQPDLAARLDVESIKCSALRPAVVGGSLGTVRVASSVALMIVRFAKNHTKEEIAVTAGADVVAGGTAGTNVKNPVHTSLELWSDRLDNLKEFVKDLMELRHDCLDADKEVEHDLKDCAKDGCSCSVPLSVLLGGRVQPSYEYVADLLRTRIKFAEDVGLSTAGDALTAFNQATDATHEGTAAGYGLLCEAYGLLLPPTGIAAEPAPGTGPHGRH